MPKGVYERIKPVWNKGLITQLFCNIEECNNEHYCKGLCRKHYNQQYQIDNKNQIVIERKQYYQANKSHISEYQQDNKEHISKQSKQYKKAHREEMLEYSRKYYQDNKEHLIEQSKQYNKDNKKQKAEYGKQYRQTPEGKLILKAHYHNRRALTKGLTKAMLQRVYEGNILKYGTLTCVLCFKVIEFGEDSLEHLIPLSRGGNNDYENLGIAHLICNTKKHAMTLDEWFEKQEII